VLARYAARHEGDRGAELGWDDAGSRLLRARLAAGATRIEVPAFIDLVVVKAVAPSASPALQIATDFYICVLRFASGLVSPKRTRTANQLVVEDDAEQ
jgi:hypothetical protein